MENRYWLFGFEQYYPSGGMGDWIGAYPTIQEAKDAYYNRPDKLGDGHIVDILTGEYAVDELDRNYTPNNIYRRTRRE